jgi:hypothetical protein
MDQVLIVLREAIDPVRLRLWLAALLHFLKDPYL